MTEAGDTVQGESARLVVPERHDNPTGPSIELALARFPTTSDDPGPPILYLAGGPGAAGIHPERVPLFDRLRRYADVVTFDQRGTGRSEPVLDCPQRAELGADQDATFETLMALHREIATACRESLEERGIDLTAYNAAHSVLDVEAIRLALGVDVIQLVGMSFGSHLGLAYLNEYPDRVARAVFAGVEGLHQTVKLPSNLDAHLSKVSRILAEDPITGPLLPDFEGFVRTTIERLEREGPQEIPSRDGGTRRLSAFQFRTRVAGSIVRRQFARFIPEEYGPMLDGDLSTFEGGTRSARTFGMRALMDCAS